MILRECIEINILQDAHIHVEYQLFKTDSIMKYERLTDNTSIIVGENGESQLLSSSLDTNRHVCRIRKIILYLLWIQLVSFLVSKINKFISKCLDFKCDSSCVRCPSFD
jgi:hypothetical protein